MRVSEGEDLKRGEVGYGINNIEKLRAAGCSKQP